MRLLRDTKGISIIEVIVATMVVTVGLTGVAAMQITAMNEIFAANSNASGASIALAWTEFISGLVSDSTQDKITYIDPQQQFRQNFVNFALIDDNPDDTLEDADSSGTGAPFVTIQIPSNKADLVKCFNGEKPFTTGTGTSKTVTFKKPGGQKFAAQDLPPPAPAGSGLTFSVAANVPVANTVTIKVSILYKNAFVRGRAATLTTVAASNM